MTRPPAVGSPSEEGEKRAEREGTAGAPATATDTATIPATDAASVPATAPATGTTPVRRGRRRAVFLLAVVIAWTLFIAARTAFSGRWWLWNGLGLAPPLAHLLIPLALLIPAALVARRRRVTLGLVLVSLLLGSWQSGLHPGALLHGRDEVPADALRVVSWNTFFWDQDSDPDDFYAYLKSRPADVYLLQEYQNARDGEPVPIDRLARVEAEFPGYHVATAGEFLTLSRYPLTAVTALRPDGLAAPDTAWADYWNIRALRTDLRVGGRTVSLYNTHLPDLLNVDRNPLTPSYHRSVRQLSERRERHFGELRADLDANENPVVLAGDINVLPGTGDLRWFRGLRDAADDGDSLYPATFPVRGPALWRLDWAFVSPGIDVHRHVLDDPPADLSTHRLIDLRLSLPDTDTDTHTAPAPTPDSDKDRS
ncbi:endonuclease/exonuclease/phosphatase family protein [Streptomyces sp. NBC_01237]|uniref:endonuclease/exonuclease/phosphatase family protein n=1 Tax=Streptomyces sp. NBC_01237 TaxID=2903790 RepID=UPI002DD7A221|nr:endonuclease/exonuclease/phosphatase family protein [Streptomyces sp. NBC_01237]WRZ74980.1 endonuclease/exonuclease/phosphatase family protein [Streptomyces sp. NBC_01237]